MIRRLLTALLLATLAVATCPVSASAFWTADGTGSGSASVDTVGAGNQPTASVSGQTVTVSWTQTSFQGGPLGSISGAGYRILRYPALGGVAVTPNAACDTAISGSTASLSCQENNVPAGQWKYSVTTLLRSWTGDESPQSAAVIVTPAAAPVLVSVTAQNPAAGQSTGSIALSWTGVSGATGYNVYRRTSLGTFNFSAPLNGGTPVSGTSYADPGSALTGGVTYAYVVRAVVGGLESPDSNELSATAIARPPSPASVAATLALAGQVNVSWPGAAGATGYNVYRRTSAGTYDYASPLNGATPLSGTSYADTATVDGTTYRYVVRSVLLGAGGAQVESVDSPESPAATADATAPAGVSLANPGSPLRGTVTLSGSASDSGSGIASLRYEYSSAGLGVWSSGCTGTTTPYSCNLVTTAITDGLYDLRVIATDAAGNATTSAVVASRRIDNTVPSATMGDPGAFLRGTVTLTATASDSGSGLASLVVQRAPTGTSTWTTVCTTATSPASCPFNTALLADGGYDLRAVATDAAGNVTTSALVSNRVVDNTAPTGTDIQTTNTTGGTAAKPESGDVITYTFSEPMAPASILAGWSGAATPVTVRFTNGNPDVVTIFNTLNTTQVALGSFTSGKKYVTASMTFTTSNMVMSGNSVAITLGTATGTTAAANGTTTLQWTTSAAATDRAGNPLGAGVIAETGTADLDF